MTNALQRYVALFGSLIIVAIVAIPLVWALTSNRGVAGPTIPEAVAPFWAACVLALGIALMTFVTCIVGRVINAAVGLFILGCGIGVVAMRSGTVADFAWEAGSLWALGIETVIWGVVVGILSWVMFRMTGGLPDVPRDWKSPAVGSWNALTERGALLAAACGVLALPVAWFLLVDDAKGQALGAVFVGSVAAGLIGRMVAPKVDPILLFCSPVVLGGIAQLVIASGYSMPLADGLVTGSLPRLVWIMPIDWAAGSLAGVAFGLGVARSFFLEGRAQADNLE